MYSCTTLLKMGLSDLQGPQVGLVYSTAMGRSDSWYSLRSAYCPLCLSRLMSNVSAVSDWAPSPAAGLACSAWDHSAARRRGQQDAAHKGVSKCVLVTCSAVVDRPCLHFHDHSTCSIYMTLAHSLSFLLTSACGCSFCLNSRARLLAVR